MRRSLSPGHTGTDMDNLHVAVTAFLYFSPSIQRSQKDPLSVPMHSAVFVGAYFPYLTAPMYYKPKPTLFEGIQVGRLKVDPYTCVAHRI